MFTEYIKSDFDEFFKIKPNNKITEILKYSLNGGKCFRSFIVKHIINTLSNNKINFWEPVVAIELLHTASLIIDDLPCMDNDQYRRGKESTFFKFGEKNAILTSLYMISESFKLLFDAFRNIKKNLDDSNIKYDNTYFNSDKQLELIFDLVDNWSKLIGENLIVGQLLDLKENVNKLLGIDLPTENNSYLIIIYKTSSLFMFSFILGAIYSGETNLDIEQFKQMGLNLGIIYQIMDDFCDIEQDINNMNFVKINGYEKSLEIYIAKKEELIILLKYNKLFTNEMNTLIQNIDIKLKNKINNNTNTNNFFELHNI